MTNTTNCYRRAPAIRDSLDNFKQTNHRYPWRLTAGAPKVSDCPFDRQPVVDEGATVPRRCKTAGDAMPTYAICERSVETTATRLAVGYLASERPWSTCPLLMRGNARNCPKCRNCRTDVCFGIAGKTPTMAISSGHRAVKPCWCPARRGRSAAMSSRSPRRLGLRRGLSPVGAKNAWLTENSALTPCKTTAPPGMSKALRSASRWERVFDNVGASRARGGRFVAMNEKGRVCAAVPVQSVMTRKTDSHGPRKPPVWSWSSVCAGGFIVRTGPRTDAKALRRCNW